MVVVGQQWTFKRGVGRVGRAAGAWVRRGRHLMRAPGIAGLEGDDLSLKAPSVAAATVEVSMDMSYKGKEEDRRVLERARSHNDPTNLLGSLATVAFSCLTWFFEVLCLF